MPTEIFFNATGTFGQVIVAATQNTTGSVFLTLLGMVLFLIALCALFKIPLEMSAILVLPILVTSMAFMSDFWSIGGVVLIYLGIILAKNFFIK